MDYRESIYLGRLEQKSRHKAYLTGEINATKTAGVATRLRDCPRGERFYLHIDSSGGHAHEGLALSMLLAEHGRVHARLGKDCSSAAAVVAVGCREILDSAYDCRSNEKTRLVIHSVAPRLVERIPILSLHDAIYSRLGDLDTVETAFHDAITPAGFSMALKRE
jgi:ATP-dependent protease ClpP protease subunit